MYLKCIRSVSEVYLKCLWFRVFEVPNGHRRVSSSRKLIAVEDVEDRSETERVGAMHFGHCKLLKKATLQCCGVARLIWPPEVFVFSLIFQNVTWTGQSLHHCEDRGTRTGWCNTLYTIFYQKKGQVRLAKCVACKILCVCLAFGSASRCFSF